MALFIPGTDFLQNPDCIVGTSWLFVEVECGFDYDTHIHLVQVMSHMDGLALIAEVGGESARMRTWRMMPIRQMVQGVGGAFLYLGRSDELSWVRSGGIAHVIHPLGAAADTLQNTRRIESIGDGRVHVWGYEFVVGRGLVEAAEGMMINRFLESYRMADPIEVHNWDLAISLIANGTAIGANIIASVDSRAVDPEPVDDSKRLTSWARLDGEDS